MAITRGDLIRRALQMKQDGLDPHEIGRSLADVARANGHTRVKLNLGKSPRDVVQVILQETGDVVFFDGKEWGHH